MQDNEKGCRVKKNYSLILYQRVTGDFYTINSEGEFTLSNNIFLLVKSCRIHYNNLVVTKYYSRKRRITLSFLYSNRGIFLEFILNLNKFVNALLVAITAVADVIAVIQFIKSKQKSLLKYSLLYFLQLYSLSSQLLPLLRKSQM